MIFFLISLVILAGLILLGWLAGTALARHERTHYVSEATARKYRRSARQP